MPNRAASKDRLNHAEWREFQTIMDSPLGAVTASYDELVADPIKSLIADSDFFARIKVDVLEALGHRILGRTSMANARVLDVGCGTGEMMHLLEDRVRAVWGCDPSAGMVKRAGPTAVHMPNNMTIPFDDGSFDIALCACVYHHIQPQLRPAHLAEIRRVLRPGGIFAMFEHNPWNPVTRRIVKRCPLDSSAVLLSPRHARHLLRAAGFYSVAVRHYLFMPQRLYRWAGRCEAMLSLTRMGGQYCAVGRVC